MRRLWVSLVAAGLLAVAAFAPAAAQDEITLDFEEVDGSGVSGNVRIASEAGEAQVTILLTSGVEEDAEHPVHIHEGTCDDLGDVVYPLENIVDGSSETTIDVDLADLRTGNYAINAHLSEDEMGTFIACADIPASVGGDVDEEEDDAAEGDEDAEEDEQATEDDEGAEGDEGTDDEDGAQEEDEAAEEDDEATEADEGTDEEAADDEDGEEAEEETDAAADDDADEEDEAMDDTDEDEETDAVAPATGSTGGVDSDSAAMMLLLVAGTGLGVGVLLRRRAVQVQRS